MASNTVISLPNPHPTFTEIGNIDILFSLPEKRERGGRGGGGGGGGGGGVINICGSAYIEINNNNK